MPEFHMMMAYLVEAPDAGDCLASRSSSVRVQFPCLNTPVNVLDELFGMFEGDVSQGHETEMHQGW